MNISDSISSWILNWTIFGPIQHLNESEHMEQPWGGGLSEEIFSTFSLEFPLLTQLVHPFTVKRYKSFYLILIQL